MDNKELDFAVAKSQSFVESCGSASISVAKSAPHTMTISGDGVRCERRTTRRFDMRLPALVKLTGDRFLEFITETYNVSAGCIFFYVEGSIAPEARVEVTMTLPSQITLADAVRVRFTGRVARVDTTHPSRIGVAAIIEEYEFLRPLNAPSSQPDLAQEWKRGY